MICSMIDCFLLSPRWVDGFSNPRQALCPRFTSDQWPMSLTSGDILWGPTPFRFENMWLAHPEFKVSVRNWWSEMVSGNWEGFWFLRKLRSLKGHLKE